MKIFQTKFIKVLAVMSFLSWGVNGFAQQQTEGDFVKQSLSDAAMVGWAGLGGAVLGLSTLSFVDEPGDHLKNIYVGASIGIIVGVALVAYLQANKARNQYDEVGGSGATTLISPLLKLEPDTDFTSTRSIKNNVSYGASWTFRF